MSDLQGKIFDTLKHLKLSSLSSAWRSKTSDLAMVCAHLKIKNSNKNRLKVYSSYQRLTVKKQKESTMQHAQYDDTCPNTDINDFQEHESMYGEEGLDLLESDSNTIRMNKLQDIKYDEEGDQQHQQDYVHLESDNDRRRPDKH